MARERFDQKEILSPSYWDGHSVFSDTDALVVANEIIILEPAIYNNSKAMLEAGAIALYHGDSQEVTYLPGTHFNPSADQLADGTLVIAEYEGLIRNVRPEEPIDLPESDNIRLPLIDYWREHLATVTCGIDRTLIPEHNAFYHHMLMWGVLVSDPDHNRALQTFNFSSLLPREDGSFKYVENIKKSALLLPIEPGGVSIGSAEADGIHRMVAYRIQGLHVVHPADGEPSGRPRKKRRLIPELGRALVPKALS